MIVHHNCPKLKNSQLTLLSNEPLRGLLTLETDQGQARVEIDEDCANRLIDSVLGLFGELHPSTENLKLGVGTLTPGR